MQAQEIIKEKGFLIIDNLREDYEIFLPRIMSVVNRVITVENNLIII